LRNGRARMLNDVAERFFPFDKTTERTGRHKKKHGKR